MTALEKMPTTSRLSSLAERYASLQQDGATGVAGRSARAPDGGVPAAGHSPLAARLAQLEEARQAPALAHAQLAEAHEALAEERFVSKALDERHSRARHLLDQRQRDALARERRAMRDSEVRLARLTDERVASVRAATNARACSAGLRCA
jgi:hypothetical protein